jgi:perosamine synthetase
VLAGVGRGDEVILPAQTFVATGLAVLYCGAKPVFADIGMDGNIDINDVDKKITNKTKAIIAVSWGGNPVDLLHLSMCELLEEKIYQIQDNAHALGSTYHGEPLSEFGDFSCYSFQAIKALSTGDGGAITCNDYPGKHDDAKRLRWFGIDRNCDLPDETGERVYNLKEVGYKYHMNNVAAAIGLGNLTGFKERQERVKQIAKHYDSTLPFTDLVYIMKEEGCSFWLYDCLVENRPEFLRAMKDRGIPVSVVHVGIDRNDIFGGLQDLPVQRYWDEHHVCLPIHSGLTDEDVEKVVEAIQRGW